MSTDVDPPNFFRVQVTPHETSSSTRFCFTPAKPGKVTLDITAGKAPFADHPFEDEPNATLFNTRISFTPASVGPITVDLRLEPPFIPSYMRPSSTSTSQAPPQYSPKKSTRAIGPRAPGLPSNLPDRAVKIERESDDEDEDLGRAPSPKKRTAWEAKFQGNDGQSKRQKF